MAEVMVRTYAGDNQLHAARLYAEDAPGLAAEGWTPVKQLWVSDEWGIGPVAVAALLILVGIGIILLAAMAVIKPTRTLMVTYERGGVAAA